MTHFKLSSKGIVPGARTESLEETYSNIAQRAVETVGDAPLDFSFSGRLLNDVTLLESKSSPVYAQRTEAQVADGNDNWILHIITQGKAKIQQKGGQESICKAGTLYVEPADNPGIFHLEDITFFDISIPRQLLASRVDNENRFLRKAVDMSNSQEMKYLLSYVNLLINNTDTPSPEMMALLKNHILDLTVLALCGTKDAIEVAKNRGLKAARLRAIKHDILAHLNDSDLSIGQSAGRLGISPQYIRALLSAEGTTFADFVSGCRVDLVYQRLTSPLYQHYSVSQLAYDAGFNNLSWFNKTFKHRFEQTPTEIRERHKAI